MINALLLSDKRVSDLRKVGKQNVGTERLNLFVVQVLLINHVICLRIRYALSFVFYDVIGSYDSIHPRCTPITADNVAKVFSSIMLKLMLFVYFS